jgi:citronellol/citronellal dehydrogenase
MRTGTMTLSGQVAFVTGASRGIGRAIALSLAEAGATVAVAARTVEQGGALQGTIGETVEAVEALGGNAIAIRTNVADETSVQEAIDETMARFGRIDILINNAGTNIPKTFSEMTMKQWDIISKVILRGTVACSKAVVPVMVAQRRGHIINISSMASISVNDPFTGLAYDSSKAAVNRLTWGLALELKAYNVAVNALLPANTVTEGWSALNPQADKSGWQTPALWGKIATYCASQDPASFTGRLLTAEDVVPQMESAGWL